MVGVLGHEAVVPACRGRHGAQEVGANELKPLLDLGLAWLVAKWLLRALVDLADVARDQRLGEMDSRLGDVSRALHGALVWTS